MDDHPDCCSEGESGFFPDEVIDQVRARLPEVSIEAMQWDAREAISKVRKVPRRDGE
jgi:hypothetical protein